MIWLVINWETKECWVHTIPRAPWNEKFLFDKICFGDKYIEVRSSNDYIVKIPTQLCVIEEENINHKLCVYYEYE